MSFYYGLQETIALQNNSKLPTAYFDCISVK